MATPFPYSQLSSTPSLILAKLLPLLNDVVTNLIKQSSELENIVNSIPTNISCNDTNIIKLRNALESLLNVLNVIGDDIISIVNTVINVLNVLEKTGQAAAVAGIAASIPVATGPVLTAAQAASDLAEEARKWKNVLKTPIKQISSVFGPVLLNVQLADQILNTICNETNDNTNTILNNISNSTSNSFITITTNPELTVQELLDQYPSTFYTELNVSDEDLNSRYQEIVELIDGGFDVINNLVELPTNVLTGQGTPANTLGTAGDFYINTQTNQLFGPKPTNGSWT